MNISNDASNFVPVTVFDSAPMPTGNENPKTDVPANSQFPGLWGHELDKNSSDIRWLWHGYLAPGHISLLTGQWKLGKTTLLSVLLAKLRTAGEFCGLPIIPTQAIVVSEESSQHWAPRQQKLGLGQHYFICRPFAGKPAWQQWLDLLDHVADLSRRHGFGFVVFDTLASLAPTGAESNADVALKALLPLHRLADAGLAVLLTHHPRKGRVMDGQAARGSGALPGFADITIEMKRTAARADRRLRLLAYSRKEATPAELMIELNKDGADYTVCTPEDNDGEFATNWAPLRMVLEDAQDKLDRRKILEQWPDDHPAPSDSALWRFLKRAANLGLIDQDGSGRKGDPFRYWLPYVLDQIREANPCFDITETIYSNYRHFLAERDKKFGPQREDPSE